jgi:hypothetical protein
MLIIMLGLMQGRPDESLLWESRHTHPPCQGWCREGLIAKCMHAICRRAQGRRRESCVSMSMHAVCSSRVVPMQGVLRGSGHACSLP